MIGTVAGDIAADPEAKPYEDTVSGWDRRGYDGFARFLQAATRGSAGGRMLVKPDLIASISPATPERSLFNSVIYAHPASLEHHLEEVATAYEDAGVCAWTVWVPELDRSGAQLLAGAGHRLDASPRQMVIGLDEIPPLDDQLDFNAAADWRAVCAVNDAAYELAKSSFERGLGSKPDPAFRSYAALHRGWPGSVLAALDHEGDCVISLVATLPEARGNRLAGRLLHRALLDARKRGCLTSSLQATRSGAPVYVRLGYRDLGALEMWERRSTGL